MPCFGATEIAPELLDLWPRLSIFPSSEIARLVICRELISGSVRRFPGLTDGVDPARSGVVNV